MTRPSRKNALITNETVFFENKTSKMKVKLIVKAKAETFFSFDFSSSNYTSLILNFDQCVIIKVVSLRDHIPLRRPTDY